MRATTDMKTKPLPFSTGDKIILTIIFSLPVLAITMPCVIIYLVTHNYIKFVP